MQLEWYRGSAVMLCFHKETADWPSDLPLISFFSPPPGWHPDHHQPAAQVPAAVRASSEEVSLQWHVLLPQAQQDNHHLDTSTLHLLHLEFRLESGQNPIPLEGLVKTGERGAVWQIMNTWCTMRTGHKRDVTNSCTSAMTKSHQDTLNSSMNNGATTNKD